MSHRQGRIQRKKQLAPKCPRTGKKYFRSAEQAQRALEDASWWRDHGDVQRQERRVYSCEYCAGFHLTSQPKPLERSKAIKARSAKTAKVYREQRIPLVKEQLAREPFCQVRWDENCTVIADTVHELKKRSRGGSITEKSNCVSACVYCNGAVEDNPEEAHARGFALHSWEDSA